MSLSDSISNFTPTTFNCHSCESPNCLNKKICHGAVKCFKSSVADALGSSPAVSQGCLTSRDHIDLVCSSAHSQSADGSIKAAYVVECCEGDLCNGGGFPSVPSELEPVDSMLIVYATVISIMVFFVFCVVGYALLRFINRNNKRSSNKGLLSDIFMRQSSTSGTLSLKANTLSVSQSSLPLHLRNGLMDEADSSLTELLHEASMTSGSGSGLPKFVQRTLSKQIALIDIIGKGRFGEVWRGNWKDEDIAVKIFFSRDELSWDRETQMYSTVLMPHENVLGYYGSDMTSRGSYTQLWLVTDYHPNGSLYDYLMEHTLNHKQMITIILSAINGLNHLHTEIFGTQGKPSMAHRDIKSKNILVKTDGSVCIADFGLAVLHSTRSGEINISDNPRVGTRRYMSPEVLLQSMDMRNFESFRKADIYAFGLVMWEVLQRTVTKGGVSEYLPPYGERAPLDPSFEDMIAIVVRDQIRPTIPSRWTDDPLVSRLSDIAKELWHPNPDTRLSALRVKKTVIKLSDRHAQQLHTNSVR